VPFVPFIPFREPFIQTHGAGISTSDLLVVAAWGSVALLIAVRTLQFSPRTSWAAVQGAPPRLPSAACETA